MSGQSVKLPEQMISGARGIGGVALGRVMLSMRDLSLPHNFSNQYQYSQI